jgi:hypothetical protein
MNLFEFDYPKPNGIEMVFSTYNTIPELLQEAKERNFLHGHTPYNKLFSDLFFSGGKVIFKNNIDESKRKEIWRYCVAFMKSLEPKHEHKEAICAMLMSEILEDHLDK